MIEKLNQVKPTIIRGYSNAILNVAKYILETKPLEFSPRGIYVTSEYCSKESMLEISKAFGCNCYGQYGQSEACLFAWTKPNNDTYYCSPFYGYVEVLDENGNHVKDNELGEVVVTAFGQENQPFIRYKTGDIVRFGGIKNGIVCLSELQGRKGEFLINNKNERVECVGFMDIHYLNSSSKIIAHQIEQSEKGKVIFKIVKKDSWNKADEQEIINLLAARDISVVFEYLETIPLTANGKQRAIVQHLTMI